MTRYQHLASRAVGLRAVSSGELPSVRSLSQEHGSISTVQQAYQTLEMMTLSSAARFGILSLRKAQPPVPPMTRPVRRQ